MKEEQKEIILGGVERQYLQYLESRKEEDFNTLWYMVEPFAIDIAKRFVTIEYQDRISYAMEVLYNCIGRVDVEKSKLLTYYGNALNRRYIDILKKQNTNKHQVLSGAYSLDEMKEEINYEPSREDDYFNIDLFLMECQLVDLEVNVVTMLNAGYQQKEIINELKLSYNQYKRLLNNIKEKVTNNYLDTEEITITR